MHETTIRELAFKIAMITRKRIDEDDNGYLLDGLNSVEDSGRFSPPGKAVETASTQDCAPHS